LRSHLLDPGAAEITVDGTIKLCEDLAVNPEDVVLLAVAFELKSPRVGEWNKQGWTEGWKNIGYAVIPHHMILDLTVSTLIHGCCHQKMRFDIGNEDCAEEVER